MKFSICLLWSKNKLREYVDKGKLDRSMRERVGAFYGFTYRQVLLDILWPVRN